MTIAISPKPGVDRTAEIQALINSAKNDTLAFAPGEYIMGSVTVRPSQIARIIGPAPTLRTQRQPSPAIIKTKPMAGGWNRVFNVVWTEANVNSPLMTISNLDFDGNSANQGWLGGHDLEHQASILCHGIFGTLNVKVANCNFKNAVADGIYVYHNTNADIRDCTFTDIYRGAVGLTGNNSNVIINNVKCFTNKVVTGIDIEPNTASIKLNVKIYNSSFHKFDMYLTDFTNVYVENCEVRQHSPTVSLYNMGNFHAKNCRFYIYQNYKIRYAGTHTLYEDSTFTATRTKGPSTGPREINLLSISWTGSVGNLDSPLNKNQLLTLKGCKFRTDNTVLEEDTIFAIRVAKNEYPPTHNNGCDLSGLNIEGLFDHGFRSFDKSYLRCSNSYINAKYPIIVSSGLQTLTNNIYGPRKL